MIDANKYATPEIEKMTKSTRKIGLGVMGFADLLIQLKIKYNSIEGRKLGKDIMSFIRDKADAESKKIANERGNSSCHIKNFFNLDP